MPKRKSVPTPTGFDNNGDSHGSSISERRGSGVPPALPKRRSHSPAKPIDDGDGLFVVEVPDSEPTTPMTENVQKSYLAPQVEDTEDIDAPTLAPTPLATEKSPLRHGTKGNNPFPPNLPPRREAEEDLQDMVRPAVPSRRRVGRSISNSPEEDTKSLPTWMAAQEEEARSKTMWVDEDAGNLHQ